ERGNAPIPGKEEEESDSDHGQRDPQQVDGEVERMAMAFAPVGQGATQEAKDGTPPRGARRRSCRRVRGWYHGGNLMKRGSKRNPSWIDRLAASLGRALVR